MITRIAEISAEMKAVKAEPAPWAKVIRQPSGVTVGAAYSALDHGNPGAVNAWLKVHNVRVWCGGPTAQIALRESSRCPAVRCDITVARSPGDLPTRLSRPARPGLNAAAAAAVAADSSSSARNSAITCSGAACPVPRSALGPRYW
jgi:hypothetical protein